MFVTCIITAKDIPYFVNTALDSLLAQSRQPDEVVIVLDGPKDDTFEIINQRLNRVGYPIPHKIIQKSRCEGTAMARNSGIAEAQGDIIAFLDGDDWYMPDKIYRGVLALTENNKQTPQYKAVFSNFYHLDERGKLDIANSTHGTYETLAKECFVRPNQIILHEVFMDIGLFDPQYPQAEDYDFWERYLRKYQIAYNPEPLFVYRRHRQAKVSSEDGYIRANIERAEIQNRVKEYLKEHK